MNQLFNENNILTMARLSDQSIDGIITSPPYNISSKRSDMYYNTGYSDMDCLSINDYLEVRLNEFKEFERIVKKGGVILYNISYIHENPTLPYLLLEKIFTQTNLTLADVIYWKKSNAIPFQTSPTKLSRIVEPIYVFVHKDMLKDFKTNKTVSKINAKTGQKFYNNYTNFVEAKNNDGFKTKLKATFSTDLVGKLINIYFPKGSTIYDPFSGVGTTLLSCKINGLQYIGSEIKEEFYNQTLTRLKTNKI
jgi:DNA modification methylase